MLMSEREYDWTKELSTAIVLRAVEDWKMSNKKIPRAKSIDTVNRYKRMKCECERFFLSEWFGFISPYNGEKLLRILKENESNG